MIILKNNKKKKSLAEEAVKAYTDNDGLKFDPNGSWTGIPIDKFEKPIQDADDL